MQLNMMVVKAPLVVRLRDASPPMAQTDINSVTEAVKNWELVLDTILASKVSSCVHDDPVGQDLLAFIISKSHILEMMGSIRYS